MATGVVFGTDLPPAGSFTIAGLTTWLPAGSVAKSGTSGEWRCGQSGGEAWYAADAPADWPAVKVLGTASASPWNLVPPGAEGLPAALAATGFSRFDLGIPSRFRPIDPQLYFKNSPNEWT